MKAEVEAECGSLSSPSISVLEPHLCPAQPPACRLATGTATTRSPCRGATYDWICKGVLVLNSHMVQIFLSVEKWELYLHLVGQ